MGMIPEGFVEYKRREFCKDVKCPVQVKLNQQADGSAAYEETRKKCSSSCLFTTWQFHHWLIEKGYLVLISSQLKNDQESVLVTIDKSLVDWIDKQVKSGKYRERSQLVADAVERYKLSQELLPSK
jgi:hypothetical protein